MLNTKASKRRTGQRWQEAIIGELWAQWFIVWELRNKDLNGATVTAKTRGDREEVKRMLREIYNLRNRMEPSVQQILCRDITDHFVKPLWFNKNWLAVHGPIVKQSVKRAKKKAIQGVRSIRQYFAPR
jgi:acid phosphatase class B